MPRPRSKSAGTPSLRVAPDTVVQLAYEAFDEDGELVERRPRSSPLEIVVGYGQTLPGIEKRLHGAAAGQTLRIELPPEEAFGPRDPKALIDIEKSELPPDLERGDQFEAEHADGSVVVLTVLDVLESTVVLDTNHPLAGQRVRFQVEVLGVRPAEETELEDAVARLETRAAREAETRENAAAQAEADAVLPPEPQAGEPGLGASEGLVPIERLLGGPTRR
jgi:FKBP-type peptidyl-prolyl cis-trans isomerase SlyD